MLLSEQDDNYFIDIKERISNGNELTIDSQMKSIDYILQLRNETKNYHTALQRYQHKNKYLKEQLTYVLDENNNTDDLISLQYDIIKTLEKSFVSGLDVLMKYKEELMKNR